MARRRTVGSGQAWRRYDSNRRIAVKQRLSSRYSFLHVCSTPVGAFGRTPGIPPSVARNLRASQVHALVLLHWCAVASSVLQRGSAKCGFVVFYAVRLRLQKM